MIAHWGFNLHFPSINGTEYCLVKVDTPVYLSVNVCSCLCPFSDVYFCFFFLTKFYVLYVF